MRHRPTRPILLVALGLAALGGACQTVTPEDRAAWDRRPPVVVEGTGAYQRVEIKTRPGAVQPLVLNRPPEARAVALFFPGSTGMFGSLGFDRPLIDAGVAYAGVAPPSDLPEGFSDGGHRSRAAHVADVEAVIRWLRAETRLPVWLVGISMGSVSVAHVATAGREPVDGAVFISSVTRPTGSGVPPFGERLATDFPLATIRVPVLAVVHRQDGCHSTPPEGGGEIVAAATAARVTELKTFEGGYETGTPCGGKAYHTFLGLRDEVGAAIAAFILANGPR